MGYQALPPKKARRGKAQPKSDNPMDYYADGHIPKAATLWDLLPHSERTGWLYDPRLIIGLSRREQRWVDHWFLGLSDVLGGQSNSATLALMQSIEQRIIPGGYGSDVIEAPDGTKYRLAFPFGRSGYHPVAQPDPEETFPLQYRSPVVPSPEQAALLNRPPNKKLEVIIRK